MFNEGDRVVLVWASKYRRGKVIDESSDKLTLVLYDDGHVEEAVTDDLISEAEYDRHEAAAADAHSVKVTAAYLVYEIRKSAELRGFGSPKQIAACDGDSLAFTLDTLREEGQITEDSRIGILYRPDPEQPGRWLVNPYANGRAS